MASVSAHTFEFVRQNGSVSAFQRKGAGDYNRREFYINSDNMDCWRYSGASTITLPRKMVGALLRAGHLYNQSAPGIRAKWKPRWPA